MIRFKDFFIQNQNVNILDRDPKVDNGLTDKIGAGALIFARDTKRVLLGFRSKMENNPHVWGNQGGHVDSGERVHDALKREIREETGYRGPIEFIPFPDGKFKDTEFHFYNFLGIVPKEFTPHPDKKWAWETEKWGWFDFDNLPDPMHPVLNKKIKRYNHQITQIIRQL